MTEEYMENKGILVYYTYRDNEEKYKVCMYNGDKKIEKEFTDRQEAYKFIDEYINEFDLKNYLPIVLCNPDSESTEPESEQKSKHLPLWQDAYVNFYMLP